MSSYIVSVLANTSVSATGTPIRQRTVTSKRTRHHDTATD
jgi:hypothetical protein